MSSVCPHGGTCITAGVCEARSRAQAAKEKLARDLGPSGGKLAVLLDDEGFAVDIVLVPREDES